MYYCNFFCFKEYLEKVKKNTEPSPFSYNNVTYGKTYYTVNAGTSKYIPNLVKETADKKGHKNAYCFLVIGSNIHNAGWIYGKWSPDSV